MPDSGPREGASGSQLVSASDGAEEADDGGGVVGVGELDGDVPGESVGVGDEEPDVFGTLDDDDGVRVGEGTDGVDRGRDGDGDGECTAGGGPGSTGGSRGEVCRCRGEVGCSGTADPAPPAYARARLSTVAT